MTVVKVEFVSDLHNEQYRQKYMQKQKDLKPYDGFTKDKDTVLVLAGDIDGIKKAIEFAISMCEHYLHVILVPGNHEYWNFALNKDYTPDDAPNNFSLFDDGSKSVIIKGVLFAGATLWTDYHDYDPLVVFDGKTKMADERYIKMAPHYSKVRADDIYWAHIKQRTNLEKTVTQTKAMKTVVISHHSPSLKSDLRGGDAHAYYYHCTDMDALISKTDLWIHGHTHDNVDYKLLDCRIVANCLGYPVEYGRKGNDFKPGWVIEL